jgi:uroporphyrinogen decarboxylase
VLEALMSRGLGHRREELTSRERVRLALAHQETDRIPIAMVCSGINPPARRALEAYLGRERGVDVQTYLDALLDVRQVGPAYVGPPLPPGEDIWGVCRAPISYGSGSYDEIERYPLAEVQTVGDLEAHRWPSTAWYDYASLPDRIAAAQVGGERCLMVSNGNIFETSWYMRGFQQMFADLALNPELAHAIMVRVTDFYVAHFTRMLAAADGAVDLAFTADDIAGQNGLLMSLDMWESFLKPYHVRLNKAIHEFGVKVIYHTDGAAMEAVEARSGSTWGSTSFRPCSSAQRGWIRGSSSGALATGSVSRAGSACRRRCPLAPWRMCGRRWKS